MKGVFPRLSIILWLMGLMGPGLLSAQSLVNSRQSSYLTYLFRLTNEEARTIQEEGPYALKEQAFHTVIDSFPTDSTYPRTLPVGHYVFAHVEGAFLQLRYQAVNPVELQVINNYQHLNLLVLDSLGRTIPNLPVRYRDKTVPFDAVSQTYHLERKKKGALVEVDYKDHTSWFRLQGLESSRFTARRLYQWTLFIPGMRLATLPLRRLFGIIRYRNFNPVYWPLFQTVQDWFTFNPSYRTYTAFHQPIYRPRDTVRARFVVLKANGKPYDQELNAFLNNRHGKKIKLPLTHPRPGLYLVDFVLEDSLSLQLDQRQAVFLENTRAWSSRLSTAYFLFQDYELKSTRYTFRSDTTTYFAGQPITLYAEGKDERNQTLLDARIKLRVLSQASSSLKWYGQGGFLPDTLWQHEQALDPLGETPITLPDSLFPALRLGFTVQATCWNGDNEFQYQSLNLTYRHEEPDLVIVERGDSLRLAWQGGGKSLTQPLQWTAYNLQQQALQTGSLTLPAWLPFSGWVHHYEFQTEGFSRTYSPGSSSGVEVFGRRTADSLFLQISNPYELDCWYSLYHGDRLIEQGQTRDLNQRRPARRDENYFLSLHYLWQGQVRSQHLSFAYDPTRLQIEIDHPAQVQPGATFPVSVSVQDPRGRPVSHTELLLYGWTAKFQALPPIVPSFAPKWPGRRQQSHFQLGGPLTASATTTPLEYPRWATRAGLDSVQWFRFIFPRNETFRWSFPIPSDKAQPGVYVFEKGLKQPIQILYVDEVPIYCQWQSHYLPYAIPVDTGKHTLRIRLLDKEITLNEVAFPAGQKTVLSLDGNLLPPNASWVEREPELSRAEATVLNRYFVSVSLPRSFEGVLRHGERVYYFPAGNYTEQLIGPFDRSSPLEIRSRAGWVYDLPYQPEYQYDFEERYVRMRASTFFRPGLSLSATSQHVNRLEDFMPRLDSLEKQWNTPERVWSLQRTEQIRYQNPTRTNPGFGRWQIDLAIDSLPEIDYVLLERVGDSNFYRTYPGYTRFFHQLDPGAYRIHLLLKNTPPSRWVSESVEVRANGLNFSRFSEIYPVPLTDSLSAFYQDWLRRSLQIRIDPSRVEMRVEGDSPESLSWNYEVAGQITDQQDGQPLAGVTILVRGTTVGTMTDVDGRFRLRVPGPDAELVMSFIGMQPKVVRADWVGERSFKMVADNTVLEEVVVTGYGVTQGLVKKEKEMVPVLLGKAAGVSADIQAVESISSTVPVQVPTDQAQGLPDAGELAVSLPQDTSLAGSVRDNFRDYAFWFPALRTDAEGKATVEVKVPDDLTRWRIFALGHTNRRQSGQTESSLITFRSLTAQLALPRFLLEGDSVQVLGKSLNYSRDSVRIQTRFEQNGEILAERDHLLRSAVVDSLWLVGPATEGDDSLTLRYLLTRQNDQYTDGEERSLPLYRRGSPESLGQFWSLQMDSSFVYKSEPALGPVYVYARGDLLEVFRSEIRRLDQYYYTCNEQTASKLKALLLEKQLSASLNQVFLNEAKIQRLVRRLIKNQDDTGGWGWWPQTEPQLWVSVHVAEALLMAEKAGYSAGFKSRALQDWLIFELEQQTVLNQLRALKLLTFLDSKVNYAAHLARLDSAAHSHPRYLAEVIGLAQAHELPYSLGALLHMERQTLFGNAYWGVEAYTVTDNAFLTTLAVYEVLRTAGGQEETLGRIRAYLLERRKAGHWRNTYESALALQLLVPEYLDQKGDPRPQSFQINEQAVTQFPYLDTLAAGTRISVAKAGIAPVYLSVSQSYWQPAPQDTVAPFTVTSYFLNAKGEQISTLKAGERVRLVATVATPYQAEYMMIRIPIPAGCSYGQKSSWVPGESYREYFRDHVAIYLRQMPTGTRQFEVELEPRFTGRYTLNPVQAELMYFPTFMGRESTLRVPID